MPRRHDWKAIEMRTTRTALFGVLLLTLGACSSGDAGSDDATTEAPAAATTPSEEPSTEPSTSDGGATSDVGVAIATTPLGDVLVDSAGMTLYMYDPDAQGASTCYDQCEQTWPPLAVDGEPVAGEGVDESLLGVVERDDGTQQVTYGQWPLYHFAQDSAAGDVNGQGINGFNGMWWVVDPAGQPVRG